MLFSDNWEKLFENNVIIPKLFQIWYEYSWVLNETAFLENL